MTLISTTTWTTLIPALIASYPAWLTLKVACPQNKQTLFLMPTSGPKASHNTTRYQTVDINKDVRLNTELDAK